MSCVYKAVNRNITLMKIRPADTRRLAFLYNLFYYVLVSKNLTSNDTLYGVLDVR